MAREADTSYEKLVKVHEYDRLVNFNLLIYKCYRNVKKMLFFLIRKIDKFIDLG